MKEKGDMLQKLILYKAYKPMRSEWFGQSITLNTGLYMPIKGTAANKKPNTDLIHLFNSPCAIVIY